MLRSSPSLLRWRLATRRRINWRTGSAITCGDRVREVGSLTTWRCATNALIECGRGAAATKGICVRQQQRLVMRHRERRTCCATPEPRP